MNLQSITAGEGFLSLPILERSPVEDFLSQFHVQVCQVVRFSMSIEEPHICDGNSRSRHGSNYAEVIQCRIVCASCGQINTSEIECCPPLGRAIFCVMSSPQ